MFRRLLTGTLLLALAAGASAAEWKIDQAHSSVYFKVRHLVISKTKGEFTKFDGTFNFEPGQWQDASANMTVKVASIDTDNEDRDKHLRSPDFFDTELYPDMTFVSKKVIPGAADRFKLIGDLTIRGKTHEVTFDVEYHGTVTDPWGNTRAGFTAETEINRQDYGVSWNKSLDQGGVVVGDDVEITLEVEAIRSDG